jgi:hypothetical protein
MSVVKIISITMILGCMGCGGAGSEGGRSTSDKVRGESAQEQRLAIQRQIVEELYPVHDGAQFECLRLPPRGPYAILVVGRSRSEEIRNAPALLRHFKIDGEIEVIKGGEKEYEARMGHIRERVSMSRPKTKIFAAVPIYVAMGEQLGITTTVGSLRCPKVYIELGPKRSVPPKVLEWAQREMARYGSDRVEYVYVMPAETV